MASKTISLREDAYERLKARKRDGESFTEVVLRMTTEDQKDFSNLIGADLPVSWNAIESARGRSEADERREELLRERIAKNE
ncbi:MAG TPA: antitoxin VapB family protein [Halococcus sp.]|nr:antitoxin VapB family protein [Halococcus sp.]